MTFFYFTLLNALSSFQVHFPGDLHGGDDNQVHSERVYTEQVHIPTEPLELAGLRGDHLRLRHHRHGGRQPGWFEDLQGAEGVEDCFYYAR